jgi:Fe2+ or Zn2+ uptake regulation protein
MKLHSNYRIGWETYLQIARLHVTKNRIDILKVLELQPKPISVPRLKELLGSSVQTVTLYRSLEVLQRANIVHRSGLGHDHAHYEVVVGRPHHHHAVCTSCGLVEDVEVPHAESPQQDALKATKQFSTMTHYSLEFFGTCKTCA